MSKRAVGYIKYNTSGEKIEYTNADKLVNDFKNDISFLGVNSIIAGAYNNDIDLKFRLSKIAYGEYGISLKKKQFIIDSDTPEFNLQEKLKVIYDYENSSNKKHRITNIYYDCYYTLKDGILNNLSVKAIKNLVNRHYIAATHKNKVNSEKNKKNKNNKNNIDYER